MAVYLKLIGIDSYDHYRQLRFCVQDAEAVCSAFRNCNPNVQIDTAVSPVSTGEREATKSNIQLMLEELNSAACGEDDVELFYFAGHGVTLDGEDYLVCSDSKRIASENDEVDSLLSFDDVLMTLKETGAGTIVALVDACRQAGARGGNMFGRAIKTAAQ